MIKVLHCGYVRVLDGWTLEPLGWMYGVHVLDDVRCPICGLWVGRDVRKMT